MLQNHPFDAFEVLGGENYYQQNGLQTALYYEEYKQGRVHPIVGSTDSHGSTPRNRNWDLCSTIVFAKSNTRKDILDAVREKYSVAVDTLSKEYRLVGEYRLQKYANFSSSLNLKQLILACIISYIDLSLYYITSILYYFSQKMTSILNRIITLLSNVFFL